MTATLKSLSRKTTKGKSEALERKWSWWCKLGPQQRGNEQWDPGAWGGQKGENTAPKKGDENSVSGNTCTWVRWENKQKAPGTASPRRWPLAGTGETRASRHFTLHSSQMLTALEVAHWTDSLHCGYYRLTRARTLPQSVNYSNSTPSRTQLPQHNNRN